MNKRTVASRHLGYLLSIALTCGVFSTPSSYAEDWIYTLRPGDNLWSIAQAYCGSITAAQRIAEYNSLDMQAPLRAGQRINIPINLLAFSPSQARIVATRGETVIQRLPSATAQGTTPSPTAVPSVKPAKADDSLYMGDYLITKEGSAVVEFADGSQLSIAPNSRVLFNKLTAFGPGGMVDTHLRFSYGRGQAEVQRQNQGRRFRIQTPEGIAAVRGTIFRVGHQNTEAVSMSNTETLEGLVSFQQKQQATEIPAGFGIVANAQGTTRQALLPAPVIDPISSPIAQGARLSWRQVANSAAYVLTFSAGDNPNIVLRQTRVSQPFTTAELDPGRYQLSVRAVSAIGVEGYDAATALHIATPAPQLLPVQAQVAGIVVLEWQEPLQDNKFTLEVMNKTTGTPTVVRVAGNQHALELPAGRYTWQIRTPAKLASSTETFELRPAAPQDIVATHRDKQIYLTWTEVQAADNYVVTVTHPNGTQTAQNVSSAQTQIPAAEHGKYEITLASVQNTLHSASQSVQVQVYRRPWWLIAIFPFLVL